MTSPAQRLAELRAKATGTYWERYGFIGHYDLARVRCPIGCDRVGRQKYADVPVHGHDAAFIVYAANNAPAIAARERELERERENYKFMYDKAIKAVDDAFQEYSGHDAILPDFLQLGDCKFTGVMKLAKAYKEQRDQLTAKDAEIGGLAMLVLLLMRRLSTDASNDKLVSQAKDYLIRKGLQGSPLRESEATDEQ